ncbi:hypothetical protein COMA1_11537 [Candidatus Nitrospira nitrosa]|uniref:Uncharacterized protein n=1 Tax=Candidatus Nitrospira nitrosa TaxID=1742972 RepID=A0A0S4LDZ4_9BACT|nr:hypothetical protein [Candidatus Nitrospira nitrosa]CUS34134.1 hypothetical protein COMA1_11537 [Candidatus Nitrospira nitrosa]
MTVTTFMAVTHPDDLQANLDNMDELKAGRIRSATSPGRSGTADQMGRPYESI